VKRLEETLKGIEGVTGEMVDKCIALGLIHVADIEEVGTGPLMEEIGMDEALAAKAVEICSEVAKVVAVEQAARKEAEAKAKAEAANESKRALDALLGLSSSGAETPPAAAGAEAATAEASAPGGAPEDDGTNSVETSPEMPGALESSDGAAPEITVHKESSANGGEDLSPEEQAIQGFEPSNGHDGEPMTPGDEESDVAALAEGRAVPPGASGDEPK
jgi:hypothetical protein